MGAPKSKKERREAMKNKKQQLQAARATVRERLESAANPDNKDGNETEGNAERYEYVLPDASSLPPTAPRLGGHLHNDGTTADAADGDRSKDDDNEEAAAGGGGGTGAGVGAHPHNSGGGGGGGRVSRKRARVTHEQLKLLALERWGVEAAELAGPQDGDSADPLFTVRLKMPFRSVPVPRHWRSLRAFLSKQTDREPAVGVVPPAVMALGVDRLRAASSSGGGGGGGAGAGKDRRGGGGGEAASMVKFLTVFLTGTPFRRRDFGVSLTRHGETFDGARWQPNSTFVPGRLSGRLREALGLAPHAPPPWLYSMQALRRLPPAYPRLRVPGLNTAIPPGASWGKGQGQWGEPVRAADNTFLFPGVMDETALAAPPPMWGCVPSLQPPQAPSPSFSSASRAQTQQQQQQQAAATKAAPPAPAAPPSAPPVVNPVPFSISQETIDAHLRKVTGAALGTAAGAGGGVGVSSGSVSASAAPPSGIQRYERVADNSTDHFFAVSHTFVPKAPQQQQQQLYYHQPPAPPQQQQQQQQQQYYQQPYYGGNNYAGGYAAPHVPPSVPQPPTAGAYPPAQPPYGQQQQQQQQQHRTTRDKRGDKF